MTIAEAVATAVTSWLALAIALAYSLDALGFRISPPLVGLLVTAVVGFVWGPVIRRATRDVAALSTWLLIVAVFLGWLMWLARPSFLPPGRGPDLTHHLLLVDYIERTRELPRDLRLEGAMGEMAHYTPGLHLLAVLGGAWTGGDGFQAIYPIVALSSALTVGFVFLVACRVLPAQAGRLPMALTGAFLVAGVRTFVADAFIHDSFLAQVVSALFAVQLWWALTVWDDPPSPRLRRTSESLTFTATVIAISALGVFLTWPVWLGPLLLAFLGIVSLRERLSWGARLMTLIGSLAPLVVVGVVHAVGRSRWILLVRASGAALRPSIALVGWAFPVLAVGGLAVAFTQRRARSTLFLIAALVAQAIVLYAMATSIGSETPYMALKMAYLAVYPLGVLSSLALLTIVAALPGVASSRRAVVAALIAAAIGFSTIRALVTTPKPTPVVSSDFYEAGRWTRTHVGTTCVDYLVEDPQTAYWLHLAVLGNPRTSERTSDVDRHNVRAAFARWIPAAGLPYAITDLSILPDEIRSRVEVAAQFGRAGVIKRPGGGSCLTQ